MNSFLWDHQKKVDTEFFSIRLSPGFKDEATLRVVKEEEARFGLQKTKLSL